MPKSCSLRASMPIRTLGMISRQEGLAIPPGVVESIAAPRVARRRDGGRERLVLRRRAARRRRWRRSSLDHGARMVDRDGERQPVATLVPGLDDADCGTVAIEERATAVTGIDGGVGLHER